MSLEQCVGNSFVTKVSAKHVLPTAPSPTMMTLIGSFDSLCCVSWLIFNTVLQIADCQLNSSESRYYSFNRTSSTSCYSYRVVLALLSNLKFSLSNGSNFEKMQSFQSSRLMQQK